MSVFQHLFVPVDGSEVSAAAIDLALRLAKANDSTITFAHAVDLTGAIAQCSSPYGVADVGPIVEALEDESKGILAAATARAQAAGITTTSVELAGAPATAVLDAVSERGADAIVIGTHGRQGVSRFFLGSTAEAILRRADVPVFVASQSPGADAPLAVIVVALDDSDPSDAAFALALALGEATKAALVLAHAIDIRQVYALAASQRYPATAAIAEERSTARTLLDVARKRADACGVSAETVVLEGSPVETLLDLVKSRNADLVAIGTHGRRGVRRLLFGSVAEGVTRSSNVPVVVVRQHSPR
jgi:nucleotide-binding universal stress UspA family protein